MLTTEHSTLELILYELLLRTKIVGLMSFVEIIKILKIEFVLLLLVF